jgi:type II secretory pathway component PulJ
MEHKKNGRIDNKPCSLLSIIRPLLKSQKGWSAVELLVASAMTALLTISIGSIYVNGQKSFMFLQDNLDNLQSARQACNILAKEIRTTIKVTTATDNSYAFSGDFDGNGVTNTMSYTYNSGNHTLTRTLDSKTTTISSGIVNTTSQPVFNYYDQDDVIITNPLNYTSAKEVEITLYVDNNPDKSPSQPVKLNTSIQLRNLHERH